MDSRPPPTDFDLETTLPYLLNRAGVRIGLAFSEEIARHDLALNEWRILASLLRRDPQTVSQLAAHTSAELSRMSRLIGGLAERRLVERRASGEDGRAVEVSLSAAGRALALEIVPLAALYERVALAGMTPDEITTLKRWLGRIYDNVQALGRPKRAR